MKKNNFQDACIAAFTIAVLAGVAYGWVNVFIAPYVQNVLAYDVTIVPIFMVPIAIAATSAKNWKLSHSFAYGIGFVAIFALSLTFTHSILMGGLFF